MDNVVSSVPELNPESDKYNPALEEIIASTYNDGYVVKDQRGNFVGTKKSFKEFAQAHVNAFREAETRGATHGQQVTRQQQSEAAVTPQSTTNSSGPKDFKDLSISEMEAKLGIVHN